MTIVKSRTSILHELQLGLRGAADVTCQIFGFRRVLAGEFGRECILFFFSSENYEVEGFTRTPIFFYSSLYIITTGAGGTKPNIATFGANQFDDFNAQENVLQQKAARGISPKSILPEC
ncbi:hypothetical protein ACLOJK_017163 [Asimina triloba]